MENFVQGGKIGELQPGEMKLVEAGSETLVLINVQGELYAINNECTHASCDLVDGNLEDDTVECGCHGARFNVKSGAVEAPPALEPVRTYGVRIEGDDIMIGPV